MPASVQFIVRSKTQDITRFIAGEAERGKQRGLLIFNHMP